MNNKKILLITPEYLTLKDKSLNNEIHTQVKQYIEQGFFVDTACINDNNNKESYEIDKVKVQKAGFDELRSILMAKKYDAILVNAEDDRYKKILETSYILDTPIINWTNIKNRDIHFIKSQIKEPSEIIRKFDKISDTPILTVTIPAYNAENFLDKCLQSLLKTEYAYLTEILVINDGSKDKTAEIGKMYQDLTTVEDQSIVKIINKENGGHGSGINKGIELAKGKYFKVVDADDWVNEKDYDILLKRLINEDADLILTDFCEARSFEDKPTKIEYYKNLSKNQLYHFDEICIGENGFEEWGPMLPTSTYKLECLKKADFKLLEKTFYVDMTYNAYSIIYIDTVKKYDLDIYRYYIGNSRTICKRRRHEKKL